MAAPSDDARPRPNIVCLVLDSLRHDHVHAWGQPWVQTPCLDRFAAESACFDRAYIGSFPTIPCRTDLMTGRFTFPHRGWSPLPRDAAVLATALRACGYTTQLIADTYHLFRDGHQFDRGFHGWEWIRGQEGDRFVVDASAPTRLPAPAHKLRNPERLREVYLKNVSRRRSEEDWFAPQVMRSALRWLEGNRGGPPFLLWIDEFDPHEPWDPPAHYVEPYDPEPAPESVISPVYGPASAYGPEELRHMRALYAGEVSLVDHWVGVVLDGIDRLGLRENTLVVVLSDHGHYLDYPGDQGQVGKPTPLYEGVAHQVCMLRHPAGLGAGRRLPQLVQPVDLLPTLLEVAGAGAPPGLEGHSLLSLLRGAEAWPRRMAVSCPHRGVPTLTTERWSLVYQPDGRPARLFDLGSDPAQGRDLAAERPDAVAELDRAFAAFLAARGVVDRSPYPRVGGD